MIGALPTDAPRHRKCTRCWVSGRMWTCWYCGELDKLQDGTVESPNGWSYSAKAMPHLPPSPDRLCEFPLS